QEKGGGPIQFVTLPRVKSGLPATPVLTMRPAPRTQVLERPRKSPQGHTDSIRRVGCPGIAPPPKPGAIQQPDQWPPARTRRELSARPWPGESAQRTRWLPAG